jgi:hypothetical protein
MDNSQALTIVRALANGVDPETGVVFPADSPYQRANTVRALYRASEALEKAGNFERRKSQLPPKHGQAWSEDDDRKMLARFDAGHGLPELATLLERTQVSVRARLVKYGRLAA